MRPRIDILLALGAAIALVTSAAAGDGSELPPLDVSPAQQRILEQLIEQIQSEAQQALTDQKIAAAEPDFASRFDEDVEPETIGIIILHRTHRNPFIDAYTRWQLLSFDPVLPEMTAQQFYTVMQNTPAMMENPRAAQRTLDLFTRAEEAGPLSPADRARLQQFEIKLTEQEDIARHLNHPAEQFRRWMAEQLGETGPLPRLWLLEQCMATTSAGWSTRSIKMRISQDFSNSVADDSFTERDRHMVAVIAQDLIGHKRQFVSRFAIKADGAVDARFSTAQVTENDVENWRNRLFDRVLEQ